MILSVSDCRTFRMPKIQYETMEFRQRYMNTKELYDLIHNGNVKDFDDFMKSEIVVNYCQTWNVQSEYVRYQLLHNDLFLLHFVNLQINLL